MIQSHVLYFSDLLSGPIHICHVFMDILKVDALAKLYLYIAG